MAKVDLTEDEVYSRLRSVSNSKGNGIYDALRSADIPWDFSSPFTLLRVVCTEAELTPLVFTGDAETVNFMKEVAEVEEGKRCDCCGQLITTPLWDMNREDLHYLCGSFRFLLSKICPISYSADYSEYLKDVKEQGIKDYADEVVALYTLVEQYQKY